MVKINTAVVVMAKVKGWVTNMSNDHKVGNNELKAKADIIRAKFSACSDRELAYFADSIYFSKFESVGEHVKSIANEYDPSLPF